MHFSPSPTPPGCWSHRFPLNPKPHRQARPAINSPDTLPSSPFASPRIHRLATVKFLAGFRSICRLPSSITMLPVSLSPSLSSQSLSLSRAPSLMPFPCQVLQRIECPIQDRSKLMPSRLQPPPRAVAGSERQRWPCTWARHDSLYPVVHSIITEKCQNIAVGHSSTAAHWKPRRNPKPGELSLLLLISFVQSGSEGPNQFT
jgi:hypothetical protein